MVSFHQLMKQLRLKQMSAQSMTSSLNLSATSFSLGSRQKSLQHSCLAEGKKGKGKGYNNNHYYNYNSGYYNNHNRKAKKKESSYRKLRQQQGQEQPEGRQNQQEQRKGYINDIHIKVLDLQ